MPGIFFELLGDEFAVDAAIANSPLRKYARIQRRGEATGSAGGEACETSGLQISLGDDEDAGLEQQITEGMHFLEEQAAEIRRLRSFPGVQIARLRFGAFWPEETAAQFSSFPSRFLLGCGELGLDIVLCEYRGARIAGEPGGAPAVGSGG